MFIKQSIRSRLFISLMIGCLIPYCIGGFYLIHSIEGWSKASYRQHALGILNQVSDSIDHTLIRNNSQLVTYLSMDSRIRSASGAFSNYTAFHPGQKMTPTPLESQISASFGNLKLSNPDINYVFMATIDGGYVEFPTFVPKGPYDPRTRPWYQDAMARGTVGYSDPYISQVTREMVISFTRPVYSGAKRVGVVGIAYRADRLKDSIGNILIGKTGYIVVLNANGKVVISPKNPEWVLKSRDELKTPLLDTAGPMHRGQLEGTARIAYSVESPSTGWQVVSIHDESEINQDARTINHILIAIYLLTLLIIFIVVRKVSNQITRPITDIASALTEIGDIAFDPSKDTVLKKHIRAADETGMISRAFIDMKQKLHEYLTTMSTYNAELEDANNLLTASEEELTAQLEEIESQRDRIHFLAYRDPLTQLPNRRSFHDSLEVHTRTGKSGAVILLDLDNFKTINDTRGHIFGDLVLKAIALRLSQAERENVSVSRFGGDEFLIMVITSDESELATIVEELNHLFDQKLSLENEELEIQFSMGISRFPEDSINPEQLIMNADLALYSVKEHGKNNYGYFTNVLNDHIRQKATVESLLRDALKNESFRLVYQPIVSLKTGRAASFEALLRLNGSSCPPSEFIPIAEETGLIIPIGRWVFETAVRQIVQWNTQNLAPLPVSINFSALQLRDTGFIDFIDAILTKYGISSERIIFEITESVFMNNQDDSGTMLKKLGSRGFRIDIDDFGTGYSSLSYLTLLPVHRIKLDRTLSERFLSIGNSTTMDSLIALAHSLGSQVVAEGIEQQEHILQLERSRCDFIQGYCFSPPIEAKDVPASIDTPYYPTLAILDNTASETAQ